MRVFVSRKLVCNHLENLIFASPIAGGVSSVRFFYFKRIITACSIIINARGCNEYGKNAAGTGGFLARYAGE